MAEILGVSMLVKLFYLAVAGVLAVTFLGWLDKRAGWGFSQGLKTLTLPQAIYFAARIVAVGLVMAALVGCSQAQAFPTKYDPAIKRAVQTYGCATDWRLLKAQYWQESRLDPLARSPAGAEGLAQFMPGTAKDIFPLLGFNALDRKAAEPSIRAGCYYMARLRSSWSAPRPEGDRHRLALASYNAGLGHILAAQRECGGVALYEPIMVCLPQITGPHARETLNYAPLIYRWFYQMVA